MGDILYNFGQGFKRARKENGYKTQQSFVDAFRYDGDKSVCLETVRNWEQNRNIPEIKMIMTLCNFFNCDMDYLFFRIDCKTHNTQFIHEETGLSENAIKFLKDKSRNKCQMEIINTLLYYGNFDNAIFHIEQFMDAVHQYEQTKIVRDEKMAEEFAKIKENEPANYTWFLLDNLLHEKETKRDIAELRIRDNFSYIITQMREIAKKRS